MHCKALFHYGETCQSFIERTDHGDQGLERHLLATDGKRCPRCRTPVTKENGCNYMVCLACNTDFCWVSLKAFDHMTDVYKHMDETHGGNGLGADEAWA